MVLRIYYSVFIIYILFYIKNVNAVSCQEQRLGIRRSECVWSECSDLIVQSGKPTWRSVLWDTGCTDGQRCCI